jgi:hypothetical protein
VLYHEASGGKYMSRIDLSDLEPGVFGAVLRVAALRALPPGKLRAPHRDMPLSFCVWYARACYEGGWRNGFVISSSLQILNRQQKQTDVAMENTVLAMM